MNNRYNVFFLSTPFHPTHPYADLYTNFLSSGRLHGSAFASNSNANWGSALWMVYAKADRRWAGADLTVVSLELLTVLGAGPLALWICWGIARGTGDGMWAFWMVVLATGELYGGLCSSFYFPY
jgi:hypothetical protein